MSKISIRLSKPISVILILLLLTSVVSCRRMRKENGVNIASESSCCSSAVTDYYTESIPEPAVPESVPTAASSVQTNTSSASSVIKPPEEPTKAVVSDEMRAVWISFLEYRNILMNKSEQQFRQSIAQYFDNCVSSGFNTVIVQARSHGDAYYASKIFPTSVNFTGDRRDTAPFDPLAIMTAAAHERNLKIHTWVNPYRGPEVREGLVLSPNDIFARWQGTDRVFTAKSGQYTYYYLNPALPEVRQLVVSGISELLNGYELDGIHFDDYFYPSADETIDAAAFSQYGNGRTLERFRFDCVSELISTVYRTVKAKKNIPFGISPAGSIENAEKVFADVRLWGSTDGYVDYLAPQIYWNYNDTRMPYSAALESWKKAVTGKSVKLVVGLAAYRAGHIESWTGGNILARQVTDASALKKYGGFILFRYEFIFDDEGKAELESLKKLLK